MLTMVESRVEQRVDQAKRYVEHTRGWRPQRRTVEYLVVMIVALTVAGIVVPRLLPGKLQNAEALIGRDSGISVAPVGGNGAVHQLVKPATAGEGYSAWALSDSREEVAVAWYHVTGKKVDRATIQVRSAYSGRTQTEWVIKLRGVDPRVSQVGFIPQHNVLWYLSSGVMSLIDIKSGEILDFPFKGPGGRTEVKAPTAASYASFSPIGGLLAYAENGKITVVTGLAVVRGERKLGSSVVLEPGITVDSEGQVVTGVVDCFTWLDNSRLAVLM